MSSQRKIFFDTGFYQALETGWKSEFYNDAVIWSILGYTVIYHDPFDLVTRILLS